MPVKIRWTRGLILNNSIFLRKRMNNDSNENDSSVRTSDIGHANLNNLTWSDTGWKKTLTRKL